ncbi:Dienelactone hydrolase [Candidatus Competibacter denitrificans Run_A_D11]|uniref:Dienelactone hydrolase n=1 Tax=Candidatus Competibacter denitrificans Run_A_D11 TaxID=1400863 RepID=W6M244_9GAMM|nr:dienelactone hydrolase family protein [Candidatus Competibacter denitrificans]CDI01536.1 Dienelactone hydrolase [Candidatus Competibacter denitrificans Run_A_D11]HAS85886.1 dienelactone hydrolase family protein [Candidatus Competibacteraceae bacterium]HRC70835.1 dienelactone hydrolase family protein [Candidatus Competibacter denitrificans]
MRKFLLLLLGLLPAALSQAAIETKTVEYRQGETRLVGYLAYPKDAKGPLPGILVVHEWMGLNDYAKRRAEQLAALGYVALAADIYGDGKLAANREEAGKLAGSYKQDRPLLRARATAGLAALKAQAAVAGNQIAAIGYCFGGTTVLELARSGADLAGVVSFHGGLDTPTPQDAKNIHAKVLALHGADDPYVPADHVATFEQEMRTGGVDWQLIAYGGAVHGFTNPSNGSDNSKGAAYNASADTRSWSAMQQFFNELFAKK